MGFNTKTKLWSMTGMISGYTPGLEEFLLFAGPRFPYSDIPVNESLWRPTRLPR